MYIRRDDISPCLDIVITLETKKEIIVAVHSEDIDGITSAALILRKFPNAHIVFLRHSEIKKTSLRFDVVIDLPKPKNCRVNIDHHKTNFEQLIKSKRLEETDLVDPNAPSAAYLVAKYYDLSDKISREIVDIANKADKGELNHKLMLLDFLIKCNISNQEKLYWIAKKLSKLGKKIFSNEEFRNEIKKIKHLEEKMDEIKKLVKKILGSNIKVAIFDCMKIPYALSRAPPTIFTKKGHVALSYYLEPSGKIKVSIRVGDYDFKANAFAEKFGGGGHEKAAGLILKGERELAVLIKKFIDAFQHSPIVFVTF